MDPRTHRDGAQEEQEVVGHLDVVSLQVQGRKQGRHPCTRPHSSAESEHHARHHAGHGGDGTNLGRVPSGEVEHIQRRKSKPQAKQQRQPWRKAQAQA